MIEFHICHVCMIAYSFCNLITGVSFHPNVISFPHKRKKEILSIIELPVNKEEWQDEDPVILTLASVFFLAILSFRSCLIP